MGAGAPFSSPHPVRENPVRTPTLGRALWRRRGRPRHSPDGRERLSSQGLNGLIPPDDSQLAGR